ncbi:MAG: hypothetical protein LBC88_02330 [Spirochaetaceae bacterium]|jgi:hypothetical protein|nr:hypothetical protein [Spirochaetaceae bacterium]
MAQRTDLYTILLSYANKHRSPAVEIEAFLSFLSKYANHYAADKPEWRAWTTGTTARFWAELNPLVDAGKCELVTEENAGKLLILEYYADMVNKAYATLEGQAGLPFPDEKTLGLNIPGEQLLPLTISGLGDYMKAPLTTDMPVIRLSFPEEMGAALFLARHLPRRALEASIVKVQHYLQNHSNKEYYAARLSTQLRGKDILIKNILQQLESRPMDCVTGIEDGGEFASLFWPYFGAQIKTELRKKNEFTSSDLGTIQAIYLIEFFVNFFWTRTAAKKERETAIQEIETKLEKQPWLFTIKDIMGFTNSTGKPLMFIYGQEELEQFIKSKATQIPAGQDPNLTLPALIIYRNRFDEQVFISKSKVFPLAAKLLGEIRPQVQKVIKTRWAKLVKTFQKEPAMEHDKDFERILSGYVSQMAPSLTMLLEDPKTYLIQAEMERTQGGLLQYTKLFDDRGKLMPFAALLLVNRKDLLADVKILLPFWYSTPVLAALVGFFYHLRHRKKTIPGEFDGEKTKNTTGGGALSVEQLLKKAATEYLEEKLPSGQNVDQYLKTMETRWRKILDEHAHRQMARDVQGLIQKKLKRMVSVRSGKQIGSHTIPGMAESIVFETPSLTDLDSTEAMKLYTGLCISKIILKG